ncbi:MAG: hypothetical protein QNJ58_09405 [Desulfobacterales bacterium]|nr:hypothetical protein [Desulfobacterales bacterium]
MKKRLTSGMITVSLVVVMALGGVVNATAQQAINLSEIVEVVATVVAIDRVDRHVTLRAPDGSFHTIEVDHAARNFDQVEIGDKVRVEFYESVALYLGQKGEKPETKAGLVVARSAKGEKPAGVAMETIDVAATVVKIDRENRKVTLKGPHGKMVNLRVDESVKGFDNLKEGDSIHARHTEAIAIVVEKQ